MERRFGQGLQSLDIGHFPLAVTLFRDAVNAGKCTVNPAPTVDVARATSNLALSLQQSGQYVEAWEEYKKALHLVMSLEESDAKYVDTMYTLSNAAALLHQVKKDQDSLEILETLVHARRHVITTPTDKVCDILGNIGNTLLSLHRRKDAWKVFYETLGLRLQLSPDNHGAIANTELALGNLMLMTGDYRRALTLYRDGIKRLRGALPDYYHPIFPGLYRNAAIAHDKLTENNKADKARVRAEAIERKSSRTLCKAMLCYVVLMSHLALSGAYKASVDGTAEKVYAMLLETEEDA